MTKEKFNSETMLKNEFLYYDPVRKINILIKSGVDNPDSTYPNLC